MLVFRIVCSEMLKVYVSIYVVHGDRECRCFDLCVGGVLC